MMRYMAIQAIKLDPAWMEGEYKAEPALGLRTANELLFVMGSSSLQLQKQAPTRELAEQFVDRYLARTLASTDANDFIYYLNASRNYDPSPRLEKITAPVLWINSADDFINPPELGNRRNNGETDAACTIRLDPHFRRDARPRHSYGCVDLERRTRRVSSRDRAKTIVYDHSILERNDFWIEVNQQLRFKGSLGGLYARCLAWLMQRLPSERQRLPVITIVAGGVCGVAAVAFHLSVDADSESLWIEASSCFARQPLDLGNDSSPLPSVA